MTLLGDILTNKFKKTRPSTLPCLSTPQPNAWALFNGKRTQSQTYQIGYKGVLLIYASGMSRQTSIKMFAEKLAKNNIIFQGDVNCLPTYTIIGFAHLIGCELAENKTNSPEANTYRWYFRESKLFDNFVTPESKPNNPLFYVPISTVPEVPDYLLDYYLD